MSPDLGKGFFFVWADGIHDALQHRCPLKDRIENGIHQAAISKPTHRFFVRLSGASHAASSINSAKSSEIEISKKLCFFIGYPRLSGHPIIVSVKIVVKYN
jgi:hypothetical protein